MNKKLAEKIKESLSSVLPITVIVLILCLTMTPLPASTLLLFLGGAFLLILGMGLFSLGADVAMMPMGERMGSRMTKTRKVWFIAFFCFIIGFIVTIAEPDLSVLAGQTPGVPDMVIILTVAAGVGLFLVVALLRILFRIRLSHILIVLYAAVFVLAFFVPGEFLAVAFDAGGVTTGPITVPFIMALGVGLAAMRGDAGGEDDSFGLIALCSIGPILAVMILGMLYKPDGAGYTPTVVPDIPDTRAFGLEFLRALPVYMKEVALALAPILLFFLLFQIFMLKLNKKQLLKILIGILYTFLGLMLFLTAVNVGFMPAGNYIGKQLAGLSYYWIMIPLGMVIGFFIVKAEPAVHVLNKQVEEVSGGAISQRAMMICLSIGMAVSVGLAMVRVMTGISILWFLIPGYAAALALTFFVPRIFTAIAFDSGGVASGPMTATFLLPFAMGACEMLGGNVVTDAFGIVAMVAMTPLIMIQLLGLVYRVKMARVNRMLADSAPAGARARDEIVEMPDEEKRQ